MDFKEEKGGYKMINKKIIFFILLIPLFFIISPTFAGSNANNVDGVNVTIKQIDVATDCGNGTSNCTWQTLFSSSTGATINLLDSKIMSEGEDYKANSLPTGEYKYLKLTLSKFEILSGNSTYDILSKLLYEKHLNKSGNDYYLYASSEPDFEGDQNGEDVMFMIPFTVEEDSNITMTVNIFLPEQAISCQSGDCMITQPPIISIGAEEEHTQGSSTLGTLNGTIVNLPEADKPVYVGFYPADNMPPPGQPPMLGAEVVVSGTTGAFSSLLPDGSYYIVGFQDLDPNDTGGMPMPVEGVDYFYNNFAISHTIESGKTTNVQIDFSSNDVEVFDGGESLTVRVDLSNINSQEKSGKKLYVGLFPNPNSLPCNQIMGHDSGNEGPDIGDVKELTGDEQYKDITINGISEGQYCVVSLLDITEEDYVEPTVNSDYLGCYGDCLQNNSTGLSVTAGQDNVFTSTAITLSTFDMNNFIP
ncbi:MAG: DUF4382 domain-containing protein [Candidatus Schekmanbacteria bacterium]|nr:MAG: DUF4382 domain-containing protein [Candidatus Schekmanbacteria bacterium]